MDLNFLWFALLGVLLTGYAILDGFDLGVGILHLFAKKDEDRRIFMNAIGPLWDGNEVWLVTFGGALFAAFPDAYATAFTGFYLAFMLLLFALIFRAVAMEFRSKRDSKTWRATWDVAFSVSSTVAALLFGVAIGNMMKGIPLNADGVFTGSFFDLLGPYPLLVGVMTVLMFAMHGAIYLYLKTEDELQQKVKSWIGPVFGLFVVMYIVTTVATFVSLPSATRNFQGSPWVWCVVGLNILAVANIPRCLYHDLPLQAFMSSGCTIAALIFLFGFALFPNLIVSTVDPAHNSLTIYNAASSQKTLYIMRTIAAIGLPFVITYTVAIYWVFRGKVRLHKFSY